VSFGREREAAFAAHLEKLGYRILRRNWRTPYGEVDLVASRDQQFYIFEIKARTGVAQDFSRALVFKVLGPRQRGRLTRAAQWLWLKHRHEFEKFHTVLIILTDRGMTWTKMPLLYDQA